MDNGGDMIEAGSAPQAGHHEGSDLVGTFHRFGDLGPAYEVVDLESRERACIRVLETGETLSYPTASVRSDPVA